MLKVWCVCLFSLLLSAAQAQQPVKGRVLEDKTRVGLINIHILNTNTKQTALSNDKGQFTIKAKLNDILVFTGFAYQPDTFLVVKLNDFEVFMLPQQHQLKDVKVTGMDGPSMAVYDPYFHGQTVAYQTDEAGNFKGGLVFRLWYFKKDERKRKRLEKMLKEEKVKDQIALAFNTKTVSGYLPLRGAELSNFVRLYTPSVSQYLSNSFNMADYLNDHYKTFCKMPIQKRLANPDSVLLR